MNVATAFRKSESVPKKGASVPAAEMSILLLCCGAVTSRAVDRANARGSFYIFFVWFGFVLFCCAVQVF